MHKTESPGSVEKFYQLQSGLGQWTVVPSLRCLIINDSLSWLAALHHVRTPLWPHDEGSSNTLSLPIRNPRP